MDAGRGLVQKTATDTVFSRSKNDWDGQATRRYRYFVGRNLHQTGPWLCIHATTQLALTQTTSASEHRKRISRIASFVGGEGKGFFLLMQSASFWKNTFRIMVHAEIGPRNSGLIGM